MALPSDPRPASRLPLVVLGALLAVALGLGHGAFAASGAAPDARGTGYAPPTGASFNNPLGSSGQQRRLLSQIIRAVNHAPKGSTIRMAVFSFADPKTADVLIAAYRRGVQVRLIASGNHEYPAMARVRKVIGANPEARSFTVFCDKSCRGTGGQMHAKYFSFGRTGAARWVTMVGSVNVTRNNAENQWSDLYTVADDRDYYRAYLSWFGQLRRDTPVARPYSVRHVGGHELHFTPVQLSEHPDPVLEALDPVACETRRGDLDPASRTPDKIVRTDVMISAYAWNGERGKRVARKVAGLVEAGCRVRVFYGTGTGGAVRAILANNGARMRSSSRGRVTTHEKMMVISGAYGASLATVRAWTGSHNWSDRALRRDDLIVQINDPEQAQPYAAGFMWMWRHA